MRLMALPKRHPGETYETGALASWHRDQVAGIAITDEDLIRRINSRDEIALAILYDRHTAMVYSVVRPILAEEGAARDIIPQVFYRIWLKASDFNPRGNTVPEFLKVIARKCAFDKFLEHGFENGGLLFGGQGVPAFNVELMTRVRKIMTEMPRTDCLPPEIENPTASDLAQSDRDYQVLFVALKAKIRATLEALRELPLPAPDEVESRNKGKS